MGNYLSVQPVRTQDMAELLSFGTNAQALFNIQSINDCEMNNRNKEPSRFHCGFFTILWVRNGSGTCVIDTSKIEIACDTVYFVKPSQALRFHPAENTEGYMISFSRCFLHAYEENAHYLLDSGLFDAYAAAAIIPVDAQADGEMESLARRMAGEFHHPGAGRNEMLRGLLKIFLLYLSRQYEQGNHQYYRQGNSLLVKKFFALLEKKFITSKMVSQYACELAVTSNYLNETIKKITGFPASHHIQQRVILEAKRKAVYEELNMKEVAYKLGFDDSYHFSKYFKNATGINFTEFKRGIAGQFAYA